MATLPLDLEAVLRELGPAAPERRRARCRTAPGSATCTCRCRDLAAAERFYAGPLELDVMVRSYPGALFVAAGGYHHHIGLNTWQSAGAPPPPEGALGLEHYELVLPDAAERDRLAGALGPDAEPVELDGRACGRPTRPATGCC